MTGTRVKKGWMILIQGKLLTGICYPVVPVTLLAIITFGRCIQKKDTSNNARTNWHFAMNHLGAYRVGFMRRMPEKRDWQKLVPDQSVINGDNPEGVEYKMAAVSGDNDFMMVYIPYGGNTIINTSKIKSVKLHG